MNAPDPERVRELFDAAFELDEPQRSAFLAGACADDVELLEEVAGLLNFDGNGGAFEEEQLEAGLVVATAGGTPALGATGALPGDLTLVGGATFGDYTILEVLGVGGMGVVYAAEQREPRRRIALKMLRDPLASSEARERFRREVRALASLKHPGIAQIYATGTGAVGDGPERPFFAMELVEGVSPQAFCDREGLDVSERLRLVARIADAVQHAHDQGVVHRDLKPGNVLVDASGQPKVLDFGVALFADVDRAGTGLQTHAGQLIGTLPYMSPEQVSGDPAKVGPRVDVYALGAILYELLAGRLPHRLERCSIPEAARIIQDDEPTRLGELDAALRGDVEIIAERALAKEPSQRYASAGALADDLRRFVRSEPISARALTSTYLLGRFARRHKALVAGLGVAFGVLLVGLTVSLGLWRVAQAAREVSEDEAYRTALAATAASLQLMDVGTAGDLLASVSPPKRGWEWHYYRNRTNLSAGVLSPPAGEAWLDATFVPEGEEGDVVVVTLAGAWSRLAFGRSGFDSERPLASGRLGPGPILQASFSGDGRRLAVVFEGPSTGTVDASVDGARRQALAVFDVPAMTELRRVEIELSKGGSIAVEGDQVVWTGDDHAFEGLDLVAGTRVVRKGYRLACAPVLAGGRSLLLSEHLGRAHLHDLFDASENAKGAGEPVLKLSARPHQAVGAALSGDLIALATSDKRIRLHSAVNGAPGPVLSGHNGRIAVLAFDRDRERLFSAGEDRGIRVFDSKSGVQVGVLGGHDEGVADLVLGGSGRRLLSRGQSGELHLWRLDGDAGGAAGRTAEEDALRGDIVLRGHDSFVYPVAFSSDGERLYSGGWDGSVRVWNPADGLELGRLEVGARVECVLELPGPSGPQLAVGLVQRVGLLRFDVTSGRALDGPGGEFGICESLVRPSVPGGALFAAGRPGKDSSAEGSLRRIDSRDWSLRAVSGLEGPVESVALSADGTWLVAGQSSGEVWSVDPDDLRPRAQLGRHAGAVRCVAVDAAGRFCGSASEDGTARLWPLEGGAERLLGGGRVDHNGEVLALAISPDGERVATGGRDHLVRIFDARSGALLATLTGHTDYVYSLAFSPDGATLASGSGDASVRLWRGASSVGR